MIRPTPTSTTLSRNGTRQPQARNCSSAAWRTTEKTIVEVSSPAGTPICGQLP